MDPVVKLILDEMQQRFSDHDEKCDRRFHDLEQSQGARLDRLEDAAQVFSAYLLLLAPTAPLGTTWNNIPGMKGSDPC